jgi:uncharacterized protein YjiS (DUF1127 family)
LEAGLIRAGRSRARRELLAMDARLLADCGISRELLEQGVGTWPWRAPAEEHRPWRPVRVQMRAQTSPGASEAVLARAAAELRAYTDAELFELGVSRHEIDRAVRRGRPGIDDALRRAA